MRVSVQEIPIDKIKHIMTRLRELGSKFYIHKVYGHYDYLWIKDEVLSRKVSEYVKHIR